MTLDAQAMTSHTSLKYYADVQFETRLQINFCLQGVICQATSVDLTRRQSSRTVIHLT